MPRTPGATNASRGCCSNVGPWHYNIWTKGADGSKHALEVRGDQLILATDDLGTVLALKFVTPGEVMIAESGAEKRLAATEGTLRVGEEPPSAGRIYGGNTTQGSRRTPCTRS
jgi:hypothetical protein